MRRLLMFLAVLLTALLPTLAQAQRGSDHVSVVGVVANLQTTSGVSTFGLQIAPKQFVNVSAPAGIAIKNLTDGSAATLADGQKAEVAGTYDRKAALLTATKIVVDNRPDTAEGTIASVDARAGSFVLTVRAASFRPTAATIAVLTSSSTVFTQGGKTVNFSGLAVGGKVTVAGAFDTKGQTLTATKVLLAPVPPAAVLGKIASVDATAGTFVLTVQRADFKPSGATITVATTAKTVIYKGLHTGAFSDLAVGDTVVAVGAFDTKGQALTAASIEIGR